MAATTRIAYYDVMKGILICLVILGHITYESLSVSGIHNDFIVGMRSIQWWFVSFYMPAFFVITGICSNFNKPFWPFALNCFKSILLPGLVFDLLFYTTPRIFTSGECTEELMDFTRRFIALGGYYWFLVSLFCAKLLYWFINKIKNAWIKWSILFLLTVVGFCINHYHLFYNHWSICQTFDLTIFMAFGQWLRNTGINKDKLYYIGTLCFILIIIFTVLSEFRMPHVTAGYKIKNLWMLLAHLITATCGTLATLALCKKIYSNHILEFFGRGSLVIYMFHSFVLKFMLDHWGAVIENADFLVSVIGVLLLFFVTLGISSLVVWIFQRKYLSMLIGKW